MSKKGTKIEQFETDDEEGLTPVEVGSPIKGAALKAFESSENLLKMNTKLRKQTERKHKARYANNHAKRGKNGKFIAKKRRK